MCRALCLDGKQPISRLFGFGLSAGGNNDSLAYLNSEKVFPATEQSITCPFDTAYPPSDLASASDFRLKVQGTFPFRGMGSPRCRHTASVRNRYEQLQPSLNGRECRVRIVSTSRR